VSINRLFWLSIRSVALLIVLGLTLLSSGDDARAGALLFVVNTTGDQPDALLGDNYCDADAVTPGPQCTLRAAFGDLDAGTEVHFDIPGCPPACTISPNGVLPSLANNNLIDGTTQPGYNGTPLITIDGTNITNGPGIRLGSSRIAKIRGMVVKNVEDDHGISGGGIETLEISDSVVRDNSGGGVFLSRPLGPAFDTPTLTINGNVFDGNSGDGFLAGVSGMPYTNVFMADNTFNDNNRGIHIYVSGFLQFTANEASGNFYEGALLYGGSGSAEANMDAEIIDHNVIEGNGGTGIVTGAVGIVTFSYNELRGNTGWGADLTEEITEIFTVNNNIIQNNTGNGLVARATGTVSMYENSFTSNGGNGANVIYEQYVGSGIPPAAAFTLTNNQFRNNFGTALYSSDEFWNFSLDANNNTFENNGQGLTTTAYSLLVADNTFSGGTHGVTSNDPAATGQILRNTLTDSETGVLQNGDGVAVNFNRFARNNYGVINYGPGVSNAINNWWGCSQGPSGQNCSDAGQAVDGNPWLVLTPSASPTSILTGQTSSILADFTLNSNGTDTFDGGSGGQSSQGSHIPDGTIVEFESDLGNFDGGPVLLAPTSGGVAGVTLSADEGPGTAHVALSLDAAELVVDVIIGLGPTPTPSATPTPGPSASATPSATPTPSASPSPSPSGTTVQRIWGNSDCSADGIRSRDAQAVGKFVLQGTPLTQTEECPDVGSSVTVNGTQRVWGNWDCSLDGVRSRDAQATGKFVLQGTPLTQTAPCPGIGSLVTVVQ